MHSTTITQLDKGTLPSFLNYQHQFVDYLRNPQTEASLPVTLPARINVYARLLHSKIDGSLRTCFPITRELLGATLWRKLVQEFIQVHRCQSPLYREIPDEFIAYLMHENPQIELPEFITDLAHYEWIELILETEKTSHLNPASIIHNKHENTILNNDIISVSLILLPHCFNDVHKSIKILISCPKSYMLSQNIFHCTWIDEPGRTYSSREIFRPDRV